MSAMVFRCYPEDKEVALRNCVDFLFSFWPFHVACKLPRPGIKPMPPAVEAWNLNHWVAPEVCGFESSFLCLQSQEVALDREDRSRGAVFFLKPLKGGGDTNHKVPCENKTLICQGKSKQPFEIKNSLHTGSPRTG